MIYLIKLATFCENKEDITKDTAELVLKIGYTNDDRKGSRFSDYISSGHRIRIIKTIPGGSIDLEHRIQKYFSQYKFPGRSQEWFCNEPEIIDAFNSCETVEELSKFAVGEVSKKSDLWSDIDVDSCINEVLVNTGDEELALRVGAELNHIVNRLKIFVDRLKYLCSLQESDQELILDILPDEFSTICRTLGFENMAKFGYQKSKLIEEYQRIIKNENLDELVRSVVLDKFKVGEKYPLNVIKSELKSIFEAFGYESSTKATALKDYFEVKEVRMSLVRCFEILSIKQ